MAEYKTKITKEQYLQAFALFVMANTHYRKSIEFATGLNAIVMAKAEMFPGGHLDDAMYSSDPATQAEFDEALSRKKIEVEDETA